MRKKLSAIVTTALAAVLTLSLAGCGKSASGVTIAVPNDTTKGPCTSAFSRPGLHHLEGRRRYHRNY